MVYLYENQLENRRVLTTITNHKLENNDFLIFCSNNIDTLENFISENYDMSVVNNMVNECRKYFDV